MQLHPTSRSRRVRRLLAVSAAAVAVMIAPTACNYGGAAQMDMPTHSGHMDGMNMDDPAQPGEPEEHQVVPVANQLPATAAPAADDDSATTTANSARSRDDRRRGDERTAGARQPHDEADDPEPDRHHDRHRHLDGHELRDRERARAPRPPRPRRRGPTTGSTCSAGTARTSKLTPHDGFQKSPACVSTAMGEIAAEDKLPSLLITDSPRLVGVNQPFKLVVSTRNLVRDRFLGAAAGGYYLESSFLNGPGPAARALPHRLPDARRRPSRRPTRQRPGVLPRHAGQRRRREPGHRDDRRARHGDQDGRHLQCTSWAGDGSHRTPMMTKANETPAIDSVRIRHQWRGAAPSRWT